MYSRSSEPLLMVETVFSSYRQSYGNFRFLKGLKNFISNDLTKYGSQTLNFESCPINFLTPNRTNYFKNFGRLVKRKPVDTILVKTENIILCCDVCARLRLAGAPIWSRISFPYLNCVFNSCLSTDLMKLFNYSSPRCQKGHQVLYCFMFSL